MTVMEIDLSKYCPHTYTNVSLFSFALGMAFSFGAAVSLFSPSHHAFGSYICLMAFFHFTEYFLTALYHPDSVNMSDFLLDHSPEYQLSFLSAVAEYWVEYWLGVKNTSLWYFFGIFPERYSFGLLLTLSGQALRLLAMTSAKKSFTHMVSEEKASEHKLITTGLYSYVRHPSYAGFFLFAVGTQIMMGNWICAVGFAVALYRFFKERIVYEEILLIKFFGEEYVAYRQAVFSGIPSIP